MWARMGKRKSPSGRRGKIHAIRACLTRVPDDRNEQPSNRMTERQKTITAVKVQTRYRQGLLSNSRFDNSKLGNLLQVSRFRIMHFLHLQQGCTACLDRQVEWPQ